MAHIFLNILFALAVLVSPAGYCSSSKVVYTASILGMEDFSDLKKNCESLSQLINPDSDFAPISESVLRDVLKEDIARIKSYIASQGFYDVRIFPEIQQNEDFSFKIIIHTHLEERYVINNIHVNVNGKSISFNLDLLSSKKNNPIINEIILDDKDFIARYFRQHGHPFVETLDEVLEVNHETLFGNLTFNYKVGPKGNFGDYYIDGLKSIDPTYIEKFIRWEKGTEFNIDKLNETETLIANTGAFETVVLTPELTPIKDVFRIKIALKEGKPNNVKLNLFGNIGFSEYEIGIIPRYTYNNLFGSNERFESELILSTDTQDLNLSITKPHMGWLDLNGKVYFSAERRLHETYTRKGVDGGIGIDYNITPYTSVRLNAFYEKYTAEKKIDNTANPYQFFVFPLSIKFDFRDNKIFTNLGTQIEAGWEPHLGGSTALHKISINSSMYLPIISEHLIFTAWGKYSLLAGTNFQSAPIDKRVYLGGGQNLRGYNKDSLGNYDYDTSNQKEMPRGGLSTIAFGIEPRFRIYGDVWGALFVDGGNISESRNPFDGVTSYEDLYWDAGLSLFYFTRFGPIRVELAHPIGAKLNKSKQSFKFYLSFGQAF